MAKGVRRGGCGRDLHLSANFVTLKSAKVFSAPAFQ